MVAEVEGVVEGELVPSLAEVVVGVGRQMGWCCLGGQLRVKVEVGAGLAVWREGPEGVGVVPAELRELRDQEVGVARREVWMEPL